MRLIELLQRKVKPVALTFIVLVTISLFFPIYGFIVNKQGKVLPFAGSLDVITAIMSFIAFALLSLAVEHQQNPAAHIKTAKLIQYLSSVPLLLLVLFFIGVRVKWDILLIGLAWRYWLLITALPFIIAALYKGSNASS